MRVAKAVPLKAAQKGQAISAPRTAPGRPRLRMQSHSPQKLAQTLRALVDELDAGPDPMFLGAGVAEFISSHVRTLKPRTQVAYEEALAPFSSTLGEIRLGHLTDEDIAIYLGTLSEGTLPAHYSAISSCLNWLDAHGHRGVASVLPRRRPKSKRRLAYCPKDRIRDLFGAYSLAHHRRWTRRRTLDVILLATLTPLRLGECVSLRHSEVDPGAGVIQLGDSKSGYRWLPVGCLGIALIGHRAGSDYVFAPPRATPSSHIGASGVSHAFKRIIRRAFDPADPLQDLCFHSLRHTWASYALTSGIPFEHVRRILGHGSAYATERYAHLTSPEMRASIESVQRSMAGAMRRQMSLPWTEVRS